jgi:hypothetical protein
VKRASVALAAAVISFGAGGTALAQEPVPLAPCGSIPETKGGGPARPVKATLALDGQSEELVSDASFERSTGTELLTLVYNVSGCELTGSEAGPRLRMYPPADGERIAPGVIALDGDPSIETSRYIVHLKASSGAFNPGTYAGFVEIKAAWLNPVRTPISLSRSENNAMVPVGWGAAGGLAGFLLFAILRWFHSADLLVSRLQLGVAGVLAVVVGAAITYKTHYLNQDVWTSSANGTAAFVVGLTASTSGVMTALLAAVWREPGSARSKPKPKAKAKGRSAGRWHRRSPAEETARK